MVRAVFESLWRVRFVLAGLFLVAVGACSDVSGPGDEPGDEPQDKILFLSTRVGGHPAYGGRLTDIFQMNTDGSEVVNLTNDPALHSAPEISPDDRTVVFSSHKGDTFDAVGCGISDVWTMAPDGSNRKRVACHRHFRLSPDGTLFASQSGDDIYVANIDGSGSRLVTQSLPPATQSCFTPARNHVALLGWRTLTRAMFYRYVCQTWTYYSVNADGTGLDTLGFLPESAYLSPDFKRIAFGGATGTSVMDVDGSNVRAVAQVALPWYSRRSPWSPDGTRLYLQDELAVQPDGGYGAHYVVNLNTGDVRQLPDLPGTSATFNGWSPRGDRIAFTTWTKTSPSPITFAVDIYVINADGTGGANLTNATGGVHNEHALWVRGR